MMARPTNSFLRSATARLALPHPSRRHGRERVAAWARAFVQGRMAGLAATFAITPFLLLRPEISGQALPVLAAALAANLAGLAIASHPRFAALGAMATLPGYLLLATGLGTGLAAATVAVAVLAMVVELVVQPGRPWRLITLAAATIGLALVASALVAPAAGPLQATLAAMLLPLAPLVTSALHFAHVNRKVGLVAEQADDAARRDGSLLAAAHAAVVIVERGGHVLTATPHAGRLLTTDSADLAGRGLVERVLIADRPAFLKAVAEAAIDRRMSQLTLRLHCGPTTAPGGHGLFVMVIEPARDAPSAASIRIAEATGGAIRPSADRAALFQTLSHEVRTPMNAILGFSEMLANPAMQPREPHKIAEYARLIHTSARGSFAVMRSLVDLLRVESTEFSEVETLDIDEIVRANLMQLQGREPEGAVSLAISGTAGTVSGDLRAVRMLFSALVDGLSAATAMPIHVQCSLARHGLGPAVEIDIRPRAGAGDAPSHQAFLGVVQELAHRLAAAANAELVIEPAGQGWNARATFQSAAAVPRPSSAPSQHNSVVPLRKSA